MRGLERNLIKIILPLLLMGEISIGAIITDINIKETDKKDGDWESTGYHVDKIEILRSVRGEAFTVDVIKGPLLRGWRDKFPKDPEEESKDFENLVEADYGGIEVFYSGTLTVDNYSSENYEIESYSAQGNRLLMELKSTGNEKSSDRPTLNGTQVLRVSSAIPDGEYDLLSTVKIGNKSKTYKGTLEIKTLPSVRVEDIDFGNYPVGMGKLKVEKRSPIFIIGGTPNEKFELTIEGLGEVVEDKKDKVTIALKNPNTDQDIEVELSIEGLEKNPELDSTGNSTEGSIKAKIDDEAPTIGGTYSGRAKIIFQYD